jgi:putative oxidoreductase
MKLCRVILRVLIGGLFVGHGTQKLFGWFGGHGLDGTGGFVPEPAQT